MADSNGVIYLEVDEDITSAIDKLTKAETDQVQMVAAKRSSLFQSVINLRLLKKAADDAKKQLVLVTNDRVSVNLAGRIGVPVASQVGEEAKVPVAGAPVATAAADDEIDGGTIGESDPAPKATAAPAAAAAATAPLEEKPPEPQVPASPPAAAKLAKPKGSRVPNIGSMQKRFLWVGLGVLVLVALFALNYYFSSAKVTLYAHPDPPVTAHFQFKADPSVNQSDVANATLAAQQLSSTKTLSASVQATGTKDAGTKAGGTMTVFNSYDSDSHTFVAGTRFVSPGGKVFRSTADVTVPGGRLCGGGKCAGQASVAVQADQNGDDYNLAPAHYTMPGLSSDQQGGIYGEGSQMQGGTTKTIKVLTQQDVDKAKQAALDGDKAGASKDLQSKAGNQQTVLAPSLQQNVTKLDSNPDVGAETQAATLSIQVAYTELSVAKADLSALAKAEEAKQLGAQKQIYDDGSGSMQLVPVGAATSGGAQTFKATATAFAGDKIDTAALAVKLKGQKYGDAMETAKSVPGVDKADISLMPSWATSVPHITKHIHIEIKVSDTSG